MATVNEHSVKSITIVKDMESEENKDKKITSNTRERNIHQMKLIAARFKFYQQKEEP